jgi:hypothetical protein
MPKRSPARHSSLIQQAQICVLHCANEAGWGAESVGQAACHNICPTPARRRPRAPVTGGGTPC